MSDEFESTIEWVADKLLYSVPTTEIPEESMSFSMESEEHGAFVWSGRVTTYTLGLILKGAMSMKRESRLGD
jgi:hypothetical protein